MAWVISLVVTLGWGAAAFGANYPWAYAPLLAASGMLGVSGWWINPRGARPWSVAVGLAAIACAVALQLVPWPAETVVHLSPATLDLQTQQRLSAVTGLEADVPLSIDPGRTRLGLVFLGAFGALLLGTAHALTAEHARRLAYGIAALGVVLALIGIIQGATFGGRIYGFWEPFDEGAPFGPFLNRNHFAGWMLMGLPVAIGAFAGAASRGLRGIRPGLRQRVLWLASARANRLLLLGFSIACMTLAMVLTLSRSGIMALAGTLVLLAFVVARRQSAGSHRVIVPVYLGFVVLVVLAWVGLDRLATRFADVHTIDLSSRPAIWTDTLRIIQDFWLTGTGLNTYGVSTLYYQTAMPGHHLREAHSDYLQLAAEGGVLVGLPVLLSIAVFARAVGRRLACDSDASWWVRMGAVAGLLAIAAQSLVDFSLQMPGNAALFAVLAGIALHADGMSDSPTGDELADAGGRGHSGQASRYDFRLSRCLKRTASPAAPSAWRGRQPARLAVSLRGSRATDGGCAAAAVARCDGAGAMPMCRRRTPTVARQSPIRSCGRSISRRPSEPRRLVGGGGSARGRSGHRSRVRRWGARFTVPPPASAGGFEAGGGTARSPGFWRSPCYWPLPSWVAVS